LILLAHFRKAKKRKY